jgi:hypothetical protein
MSFDPKITPECRCDFKIRQGFRDPEEFKNINCSNAARYLKNVDGKGETNDHRVHTVESCTAKFMGRTYTCPSNITPTSAAAKIDLFNRTPDFEQKM